MNKKRRILIHPDHIEDLDAKEARLKKNAKEPVRTGYSTICRLRNTDNHRDIILKASFVADKIATMTFMIFHDMKNDCMMLQPVPASYIHRTSVCHVQTRFLGFIRRYGYCAELDRVPEPCSILMQCGISPLASSYKFKLEEYRIQDEYEGELFAYRFIPLHA